MNSRQSPPRAFRLEGWLVELSLNEISAGDLVHHLEPKVMELLVLLAECPGELITKETLIERIWPERAVTDAVITTTVWELRRALGDDAKRPRYIQTIPRKGYRLIAAVTPVAPAAPLDSGSGSRDCSRAARPRRNLAIRQAERATGGECASARGVSRRPAAVEETDGTGRATPSSCSRS